MSSCGHVSRHDSHSFFLTQRSERFQERAFKSHSNVKMYMALLSSVAKCIVYTLGSNTVMANL